MTPLLAADSALLQPSLGLMLWTLITFFVVLVLLNKLVFGRIQEALDNRRKVIAESVDAAERVRDEAAQLLDEYKAQLATARVEAEGIVDRARKAGDELTARVKQEAEVQRKEQIAQTQSQVQAEIDRAMSELRTSVVEMTVTATEKVLRGSIDTSGHQKLIEQAVEDLDFESLQQVGAGR